MSSCSSTFPSIKAGPFHHILIYTYQYLKFDCGVSRVKACIAGSAIARLSRVQLHGSVVKQILPCSWMVLGL